MNEIVQVLRSEADPAPLPKQGRFVPDFLGLIPTRGCNLACEYCGFLTHQESDRIMDLQLARDAIRWYMDQVVCSGLGTAEIHFFGGEPFCADEVVDFAYHFARVKAAQVGCDVRFEVATNGTFDEDRCRWAANSLDSIILSLDGPDDIQNRHRPGRNGRPSFETVVRSAKILSQGEAELSFRTCVTAETVDRLPEIAAWLCREFRPAAVCFEPIQPTAPSQAAGLHPPQPWDFARNFIQSAQILEAHGVEAVYATSDIHTRRVSFCPVARDVAIVSADGTIDACYLLREDWEARGLDLRLGRVEHGSVRLDDDAVPTIRDMNVWNKPLCTHCFCKWHCAGGCHVNHELSTTPGDYDDLCIQTRIIALRNILKAMEREDLVHGLLRTPQALDRAVWQPIDTLSEVRLPA
ncbi:MAG: radical SAM protein [Anaerolineae bacterium]